MKPAFFFAIISLFTVGIAPSQPDLSFRLSTIERRIDQMQIRVDAIEREFRTQTLMRSQERSGGQAVDDLKQQYVGLSEQVSLMQLQLVEVRKTIDRLTEPSPKEPVKDEKKKKP